MWKMHGQIVFVSHHMGNKLATMAMERMRETEEKKTKNKFQFEFEGSIVVRELLLVTVKCQVD